MSCMILVAPGQPHIHVFQVHAVQSFFSPQNPWIPDPLKEITFKIMQLMILDQLMFKSSLSAHNFTVSRKMPARGLYRKLSETDRARALGCIDAGMRSREAARWFRTSHQTINRIVQRYRHSGQFKGLPRSGRPRVTTRAEDRYVTNDVARNRFVTRPEVRSRLYAARGPEARPVSAKIVRNRIHAGSFKSMVPAKKPELRFQAHQCKMEQPSVEKNNVFRRIKVLSTVSGRQKTSLAAAQRTVWFSYSDT